MQRDLLQDSLELSFLMRKKSSFYDNKLVIKPWGYEYTIYRHQNKLSVTFLKINKNHRTSLHCHPKKKTGFIVLDGKAKIQLAVAKGKKQHDKRQVKKKTRLE